MPLSDSTEKTELEYQNMSSPSYRAQANNSHISQSRNSFTQGQFWTQSTALWKKNYALQVKQRTTNICQLVIPVTCLLLTLIFKELAKTELHRVYSVDVGMPYFFNIPYSKIYNHTMSPVMMSTCLEWYLYDFKDADEATKSYVLTDKGNEKSGLLTHVFPNMKGTENYYKCPKYNKVMPYFEKLDKGTINEHMFKTLEVINTKQFIKDRDNEGLDDLPDGAITFYKANDKELNYKLQINDVRLYEYHRGNGISKIYMYDPNKKEMRNALRVADGQLVMLDMMARAYLAKHNPNVVLVSASQYMPFTTSEEVFLTKILSILGATLYPIALSVILPVFLQGLVLEKEERLREMMKMNGMKMKTYWIINYIWCLVLYLITSKIFMIFGRYVLKMPFFTDTSAVVLFAVVFGWGLSQVSMAFFFQNFMSKVRTSTVVGYLLSIWTCIVAIGFNVGAYPYPNRLPMNMKLYPPFAFCRLIYLLSIKCSNYVCNRGFFEFEEEMWECLIILYVGAAVLLLLGIYLNNVLPQDYGVTKSPLYFLNCFGKKKEAKDNYLKLNNSQGSTTASSGSNNHSILDMSDDDADVVMEQDAVEKLKQPFSNYPLIIKNIRKVYKPIGGRPAKVAVENITFHLNRGEMFGLLGPNGAGKTSLISMLTGLYQPNSGDAWVGGYSILDQIEQVHGCMGVCPQFDLLWPDLTVEEHLIFYSRIRGVPDFQREAVVNVAMAEVRLTRFAKFETRQLSGGMKRRLSVAIAFVGNPQIIFLDEPTTGLDPDNRRQLWNILLEARKDKAMVLTTHSMDEADVLCSRIGIIVAGKLKCIGPQTRLKTKFGGGYQLLINCHKDKYLATYAEGMGLTQKSSEYFHEKVLKYVQTRFPTSQVRQAFHGSFIFQIPTQGLNISDIFEEFEAKKEELAISDWGISQCTLEDVFMEIVKDVEEISPVK